MATTLFRAWTRRATRYLATRRVLRLYRDIRCLVDTLAIRAECPKDCREFRKKVTRLRNASFIGEDASQKLKRLSTMARKAGAGEITLGELLDLVRCARKLRRILTNTERRTRNTVPLAILAGRLGVPADWIAQSWLQREVDPLPSFKWCDGLFVNVDKLRDWQSTPALAGGLPLDLHPICGSVEGGAA